MPPKKNNESDFHLYALHGFLGLPSDWEVLFDEHPLQDSLKTLNLFSDLAVQPFKGWTSEMTKQLEDKNSHSLRVLMGYSLGGRLALHLALHSPQDWDALIIVSAHLGLPEEKRQQRLEDDEKWAQRFEMMPWKTLMQEWNGRSVFGNDRFAFERKENDYDRNVLAAVLRDWSLGNQQDLSTSLQKLACPVLWIAGAEDKTYAIQAQRVKQENLLQHPDSKICLVPECGHRVPWQNKDAFMLELTLFLEKLKIHSNIVSLK